MARSGIGHSSPRPQGGQRTISKLLIVLIFGFSLVQKLVVVWQLKDCPTLLPIGDLDSGAYADLARQVLAGNIGLGPGLYFVSPLYIYFLAAGLAVTKSYTAVRIIQVALGTAAIGAIWLTAREWFGERAGWLAAGLAALTGLFTFYESLIFQASLDPFLTSAALLCLTLGLRRERWTWFLAAGLVFGLQALNRPNILLSTIGLVLVAAAFRRWRPSLAIAAGLVIGMSPALIRNVIVSHQFSLASSQGGLNFFIGNGEGATGFYRTIPGVTASIKGQQEDVRHVAAAALGRSVSDQEASSYFVDRTLSHMAAHPGQAAWLLVKKFGWAFHAKHVALPYSYPFYQYDWPTVLRFLVIGPWLLVPLGLVGLVFAAPKSATRDRAGYLIFASFVPLYAAAVAVFLISERYRLPLLVPLAIGSGAAIDWAIRARSKAFAAAVVFVAIAVAANTGNSRSDGRWEEGLRLADQYVVLGQFDEAEKWIAKLEATAPQRGMAHHAVGLQLVESGQPARAMPHFQQALALGLPLPAEEWLKAGRLAASEMNAPPAAEPFFARAVAVEPGNASARLQHGANLIALGRIEDAAGELAEAARLDPQNAAAFAQLAYAEARLNRIDDAKTHVRMALAIDPSEPMAKRLAELILK